jgi:hypothetical protein
MEINQLRVHERVTNFLYSNFEQGVFRVDEEGYEYVDEKYINLYDSLASKIWATESLIWI